ncbi:unnamed protein product, partial [Ectocarpus sp. 8 AP-2014]
LVAGNHLALVLRLGAGLLCPPSPVVRFLQSLLLPTLLLLGLWFVPPPPLRCWRSNHGGSSSSSGRGRQFSAGRSSWHYLRLFEEGRVAGQQQQQQQTQEQHQEVERRLQTRQQQQTQEQHQEVERQQLQTRQRQQTRQQVERQRPTSLGGNCSTAFVTAATSAALGGGGSGGGGGESDDGGGLELAVARFRRRGGEDHERSVWRQTRPRRPQRRELPMATSALPSPAKEPPTEAIAPGASGIGAVTEAAAARAAAASAAPAAARAEAAAAKEAEEVAAAAAAAADGLFPPSSRHSSPPLPLPRRRWQGGNSSQPSPSFLENLVASAGFGGLLFLTVLLAGSPWAGDDWAPSPGLGVFWSALRQASVVVAWGIGRAFASTTASASSPAGTAASGTRARVACPSAPETAVLLEGGREGEEMMQAAAVPAASAAPAAASPSTAAPATATSAAAAAAAAAAGSAGEGSQEETKGERNDPAAAAATSVAEAAAVDDNDFDEEGGLLEAAGTGDGSPVHSPVHSPAEITVAAEGSRRRAELAAALHTCGAEEEEFGRSEASAAAAAAVAAAATAAGDVRRGVDGDDDAASCLAAAAVLVAGVSAIALCPERPLAVVPGISAVALVLPSLWTHLETSCPPGGVGNAGAAVSF